MPRAKASPPAGPCPSSPPPRPARRSRATCRAAQDDAGEPREEEPHSAPRRERPAKRKQAADGGPAAQAEGASDGSPWPALPHTVLCAVLSLLDHEDVVSAGQTCRSWRQAARHRDVWRRRELQYQVTDHRSPHFSNNWHRNARRFSRIARFAPCAATVCCNRGMLPAARKALFTQSQCQPKAVELNGATVAAEKYLKKWQEFIEDVTLLNPSPGSLRAAVSLPKLTSLSVKFKFDPYNREYEVPSLRGPGSTTLKNLTLHRRVHFSGVDSLLRAHATTLENVSAYCFPSEALSVCTALRRLAIEVDPETDGQRLLNLLRAVIPLERLDFQSDGGHDAQACSALRGRIKDEGLALRDVGCDSCERGGPVVLEYHRMRGCLA